jgi:hypothetical protein
MSIILATMLATSSPYMDIPPRKEPPMEVRAVPLPARVLGGDVSVDYICRILLKSGNSARFVIRAYGKVVLIGGQPLRVAGLPFIDKPKYLIVSDESKRFLGLSQLHSWRYSVEDGDIAFIDKAEIPKLLLRLDYLYSTQQDRGILLFVPDPQKPNAIMTEAGICEMSDSSSEMMSKK